MTQKRKRVQAESPAHTRQLRERTDKRFRDLFSCAYGNVMAYLDYRTLTGNKFPKGKLYVAMFEEPFQNKGHIRDFVSESFSVFNACYLTRAELMRRSFHMRRFLHNLWKKEKDEKERVFIDRLITKICNIEHQWMVYFEPTKETDAIDQESDKLHWEYNKMREKCNC